MIKIPLWKMLLSYVWEWQMENIHSPINGELQISYHKGNFKLSTNNAIYSFGKKYTSFGYAFQQLEITKTTYNRVLILGVGLGSIIQQLDAANIQHIDAVDCDTIIIELCRKYLSTSKNINYIVSDAVAYIETTSNTYDLILADIFIDNQSPNNILQKTFIANLWEQLNTKGVLLFSKLNLSHQDKAENKQFELLLNQIIGICFSIHTDGNIIYVAIKD